MTRKPKPKNGVSVIVTPDGRVLFNCYGDGRKCYEFHEDFDCCKFNPCGLRCENKNLYDEAVDNAVRSLTEYQVRRANEKAKAKHG